MYIHIEIETEDDETYKSGFPTVDLAIEWLGKSERMITKINKWKTLQVTTNDF
jgi:hypothetical protein